MVDKIKIEQSVRLLLEAIGDNPDREGLLETPKRVANMYADILSGYEEDAKKHLKVFCGGGAGGGRFFSKKRSPPALYTFL